jgi:hypothetical protein
MKAIVVHPMAKVVYNHQQINEYLIYMLTEQIKIN